MIMISTMITLKKIMYENPLIIENLFLKYNIEYNLNDSEIKLEREFRFNLKNGHNISTCRLRINPALSYSNFKTGDRGDIFDLLKSVTKKSTKDLITDVYYEITHNKDKISYESNNSERQNTSLELIDYGTEILNCYPSVISDLFLEDGIDALTQAFFDIRYFPQKNRILIPIFLNDKLVGINGRINEKYPAKTYPKYYTVLPYPKTKVLYGVDINKEHIINKNSVILVESEKSVMKAFQLGIRNVLAIGNSILFPDQLKILQDIGVENILLCLDKGLEDSYILKNVNNLKKYIKNEKIYKYDANKSSVLLDKECIFDKILDETLLYKELKKNTGELKL